MNTPNQLSDTPRTDAAWAKTFEDDDDQCREGNAASDMRDACATLERELAALTTERDQLRADCENETKWAAHYLAQSIADKARAERAEAELKTEKTNRNHLIEKGLALERKLTAEREKSERYRLATLKLRAELATERARSPGPRLAPQSPTEMRPN
jgi:hypothetical protein